MWICVTRVSHPSQMKALAFSRPILERAVHSSLSGAGQLVKGVFVRCWVSVPAAWLCWFCLLWHCELSGPRDLHCFPPTCRGDSSSPSPSLGMAPQHIIFPRHLISFALCKIAPDICDYSKPLNCLFRLHLLGCDRLSFIFTATLHLLFLCAGLFMLVSVQKKPLRAGIHQCTLSLYWGSIKTGCKV